MSSVPAHPCFASEAFRGRNLLVTGGGHGIGRSIVRELASLGARVTVLDLYAPALDELASILNDDGTRDQVALVRGDVSVKAAQQRAVRSARERGTVDGLVHSAMFNPTETVEDQDEADFRKAYDVNTFAAWALVKRCLSDLRTSRGAVVLISSIMADGTTLRNTAYTSSKAAVEGLTRGLAIDLAHDSVRVNAVAPGYIHTTWRQAVVNPGVPDEAFERFLHLVDELVEANGCMNNPLPRAGRPEDIAHAVTFLLSDAASFITGQTWTVDGGARLQLRHGQGYDDPPIDAVKDAFKDLLDQWPLLREVKPYHSFPSVKYPKNPKYWPTNTLVSRPELEAAAKRRKTSRRSSKRH